jgi:hypothetical protein
MGTGDARKDEGMTFFELYVLIGVPTILLALMALVYFEVDAKLLRSWNNRDASR